MSDGRIRLNRVDHEIKETFRDAIPGLDERGEFHALKENVLRDGRFLDPVKLWDTGDGIYLVDGHHCRDVWLTLAEEGHDIEAPFVEYLEFEDADAVLTWIRRNAVGQRNLPTAVRDRIIAEEYEKRMKPARGGDRKSCRREPSREIESATVALLIPRPTNSSPWIPRRRWPVTSASARGRSRTP